jgi:two-component system sensor histidine kinase KdpD
MVGMLRGRPREYFWGLIAVGLCTAASELMSPYFQLADLIMVYLLGVVMVSTRFTLYPSMFTAVASVLSFDFFFLPPRYSFAIFGPKHLLTLFVMLVAAMVISGLTERERRRTDDAHRAQAQIESERLRSLLLSSISHDLRTPLAAIVGATSTMLEDESTLDAATRRELTQTVFEEAERLHRLVTNLLHMTRLEAGPMEVHRDWQPIEEVIGAALTRLEPRLRDRTVTTHLPETLTSARFDAVLIEQVLTNLLENAVRHTPSAAPIDIGASATDTEVTIDVSDRGPGVSPEQREKIFEKFYRANRARGDGGMGLGLTICRGIVLAHGGRIWVEGRSGGGSVFRVMLPRGGPSDGLPLPEVESSLGQEDR